MLASLEATAEAKEIVEAYYGQTLIEARSMTSTSSRK
jgi:hypothetical protein